MGILDNIINRSPFLRGTQNFMGQAPAPQAPAMPPQNVAPQIAPAAPNPYAPQPGQGGQQGGGLDMSMIMKIMSMFGGA